MKLYQYEPLDENEIRLVTLPPKSSGNITICIQAVDLSQYDLSSSEALSDVERSQSDLPCYEALSYAWGSTENLEYIEVQVSPEGAAGNHKSIAWQKFMRRFHISPKTGVPSKTPSLAITHNLAQALPYLQLVDRSRLLWIDANLTEKGRQVKQMSSIYRTAASVVVWLGPSTKQLTAGLKAISHLASMLEVDFGQNIVSPASGQDPAWADRDVELPYDDVTRSAINTVIECPWFERLWIWQEIHARPESSTLLCGSTHLTWTDFRKAMHGLEHKILRGHHSGRGFDRLRLGAAASLCRPLELGGFSRVLEDTEEAKCLDPRDRIYALLALRRQDEQFAIEPDYTAPFGEVYRDFTVRNINVSRNLNLLTACELHDHLDRFPSWVRDWSKPGKRAIMHNGRASLYSRAEAVFAGSSVLKVAGVEVTTVETVNSGNDIFSSFMLTSENFFQELFKLLPHESNTMESVLRALTSNQVSDAWYTEREEFPNIEDLQLSLRERRLLNVSVLTPADRLANSDTRQDGREPTRSERLFHRSADTYTEGRALITTSGGQIGLGPDDTQAGDKVCILLGCSHPLVLRPSAGEVWQVVGPCYVHGLMSGEAFLGPLPDHCGSVQRQASSGFYNNYLDRRSGEMTPHDPRADPLPPGWELIPHDMQDFYEAYLNTETGEKTAYDPRLTSKALRERGVPMRTFNLV